MQPFHGQCSFPNFITLSVQKAHFTIGISLFNVFNSFELRIKQQLSSVVYSIDSGGLGNGIQCVTHILSISVEHFLPNSIAVFKENEKYPFPL